MQRQAKLESILESLFAEWEDQSLLRTTLLHRLKLQQRQVLHLIERSIV
jgi:hypothetical protein